MTGPPLLPLDLGSLGLVDFLPVFISIFRFFLRARCWIAPPFLDLGVPSSPFDDAFDKPGDLMASLNDDLVSLGKNFEPLFTIPGLLFEIEDKGVFGPEGGNTSSPSSSYSMIFFWLSFNKLRILLAAF